MITLFNRKNTTKNPNLILAALKLIELISVVQLEEFYVHQWIFIFDYFGLTIEPKENFSPLDQDQFTRNVEQAEFVNHVSPFEFQPYVTNALSDGLKIDYFNNQTDTQTSYQKKKRQIIMTQTNVESDIEIKNKALWLCKYLITVNEFRTEVEPIEIENQIEGDFISLDDYIFKMH
eukprot:TRINITY_DN8599_c0_g1_i4.p1 TRINITY_DN8599_c0_g1~~TRINITY_DN8599_c0_g1_i4.p1  ORF type:complete len:176 (-),score=58.02 TRINITY_DN8599_c0_g1_i4:144-671(-)